MSEEEIFGSEEKNGENQKGRWKAVIWPVAAILLVAAVVITLKNLFEKPTSEDPYIVALSGYYNALSEDTNTAVIYLAQGFLNESSFNEVDDDYKLYLYETKTGGKVNEELTAEYNMLYQISSGAYSEVNRAYWVYSTGSVKLIYIENLYSGMSIK